MLLDTATIHSLQMGLALNTTISIGILGVGYAVNEAADTIYPSIMDDLVSQKLIGTRAYSLYLDSYDSPTGSILFGAIDTTKFIGDLVKIDVVPARMWNGSTLYSSFDVELVGLGITEQEGNTINFKDPRQAMTLDSGTSIIYLPANLTDAIYNYFNAYDDTIKSGNVYIPCSLLTTSPDLTMNYLFSSGSVSATIRIPLSELIFPLTNPLYAPHPGTSVPELPFKGDACGFAIQSGSDDNSSYILGDTFLRSAYVVYDLEHNQVGLAQSNIQSNVTIASSDDVELKAGETALPSLTGVSSSSRAETSSTSTGRGSKTSDAGSLTATPIGTAKATSARKNSGVDPISRSIDFRVLGIVVLGGLIFSSGMMVL